MIVRRHIVAGLMIGLLAGLVAAIAIPRTRAAGTSASASQLGPPGVLRAASARRFPRGQGFVGLRSRGPIRIEARVRDPLGGPDWAVRVFRAERVVAPSDRRPGVNPVIGHDLCAQLGRIYKGRFGWLDAAGTFRPVAIDTRGAPTTCGSRQPDLHGQPYFDVVIPITDPRRSEAHAKQLVVWGLGGSAATSMRLRLGASAVTAPHSAHGAMLAIAPAQLRSSEVRGIIRYRDGHTVSVPRPVARRGGTPVLSGRAPDPNGGLPYALLSSGTCTEWGSRILDDGRFGDVNYELGTFSELRRSGSMGCSSSPAADASFFRRIPVMLGYGGGSDEPGTGHDPGRVARRTQPGTTVITGRVAPDVVAVTLETPRDVRTLVPSGPAHAIIAVYDGTFPTGSVDVIARYKDGHTKTQKIESFGF